MLIGVNLQIIELECTRTIGDKLGYNNQMNLSLFYQCWLLSCPVL